jgi:hypothetical protein
MSLAADDAPLPDDPEFRAAFVGYVEWDTRLALIRISAGDAKVDAVMTRKLRPDQLPKVVAAAFTISLGALAD